MAGAIPPSAFPFSDQRFRRAAHSGRTSRPRLSGGRSPVVRGEAKQGGFRGDSAGEKNNEKSSDTPLLFMNYYGIM